MTEFWAAVSNIQGLDALTMNQGNLMLKLRAFSVPPKRFEHRSVMKGLAMAMFFQLRLYLKALEEQKDGPVGARSTARAGARKQQATRAPVPSSYVNARVNKLLQAFLTLSVHVGAIQKWVATGYLCRWKASPGCTYPEALK